MIGACIALTERALLAVDQGAWDQAARYLAQARSVVREAHLGEYPAIALMHAAAARVALHQGDLPEAGTELIRAQRLRPDLTYALPYLAVQVRLELARCHLALLDTAAARTQLREADEILRRRPGLGVFVRQAKDLRAELARAKGNAAAGASALTAAELRLLPMLCTHLSLPEIAAEMFLSRNTIRSQAYSIYRKLGVSSRSQAVAAAGKLGLLER
jgi:LuxR family maltose regulon positive regulatory protein